jgi:hypothetical protein
MRKSFRSYFWEQNFRYKIPICVYTGASEIKIKPPREEMSHWARMPLAAILNAYIPITDVLRRERDTCAKNPLRPAPASLLQIQLNAQMAEYPHENIHEPTGGKNVKNSLLIVRRSIKVEEVLWGFL